MAQLIKFLLWGVQLVLISLVYTSQANASPVRNGKPFLVKINNETAIIGNDFWNVTIGRQYGTKLWYKGVDLVGNAVGHYVSYSMFCVAALVCANAEILIYSRWCPE